MTFVEQFRAPRWLALAAAALIATSTRQGAVAQDATPPPGDTEITTQLPAVDLPTMNEQGFVFE
ncbi:MAG: hypothetical protein H0U31_06555, partial [Chloroflexia bacterium]|nr:hypothetical protein [Chloroflexia bacterium]